MQLHGIWSARRVSIILTILALGLWSYSITQAKFNIGLLGLIHGLPVSFFIALGLLTIASTILWRSPQNHSKLLFLQLILLTASLWLTPLFTGGSQESAAAQYLYMGWSEYIIREGHYNQNLFLFHNWPGTFSMLAMFSFILGLPNPDALIIDPSLISFLVQLVYLLFVYILLKNMLGEEKKNLCWAGLWIFELGYWIQGAYLGPSTFGYIFLIMILVLLVRRTSYLQSIKATNMRILGILSIMCITITHLLSDFVALASISMLWITRRTRSSLLTIVGIVALFAWLTYVATAFFEANIPVFLNQVLRLDVIFQKGIVERIAGSESRQFVSQARVWFSALFLGIGGIGFILSGWPRKRAYSDNTALFLAIALIGVAAILSFSGGKEMFERTFHFLLPLIAYFGIKLMNWRITAIILCIALIIALPLHFISHYGAEELDYFPESNIYISRFFFDHTDEGTIISCGIIPVKNVEDYKTINYQELREEMNLLFKDTLYLPLHLPLFVTIDTSSRNRLKYLYDDTTTVDDIYDKLEESPDYYKIYVNPDLSLYVRQ